MTYFVGIDVSLDESSICVINNEGEEVLETSVNTNPESIADAISDYDANELKIALETGPITSWLWHEITGAGLEVVVIDARSLHQVLKTQRNKTDKNDARGIAQVLRTGWYRESHVKSYESHALRALLKSRTHLINMRQDLENTVRGLMKPFGLRVPPGGRAKFAERVREVCANQPILSKAIEPLLHSRREVIVQISEIDRTLLSTAKSHDDCRRLMTVPGVGPITSLAFVSAIGNGEQFPRPRSVGAFFGLTPRRYQSGDVDYQGRICKRGDNMVRTLLYEAANVLITVARKSHPLRTWGRKLAKKSGMQKARVAVARKLAVLLATILKDGTEFEWPKKECTA